MDLSFLPHVNAGLNALATVLLLAAWVLIRRDRRANIRAHACCTIAAFAVSLLFLVLYVGHKVWKASEHGELHTSFNHTGALKWAYLGILFTHLVLAMTVPVFAVVLLGLGLTRRYELHRRIARVGWPIWMYVSVTGVVVYVLLYHLNPPAGG